LLSYSRTSQQKNTQFLRFDNLHSCSCDCWRQIIVVLLLFSNISRYSGYLFVL